MQSDVTFSMTQRAEDIGLVSLGDAATLTCGRGRAGSEDKRYQYN